MKFKVDYIRQADKASSQNVTLIKWQVDEKSQVDGLVSGLNGMLVKCQVDKISSYQNDKMIIYQFDEMASGQSDKLMKRQVDEMLHL